MYVEEKKQGETNIDDVGKVLLDAADYIERHGWCQHIYQDHAGKVCAAGALLHVAIPDTYHPTVREKASLALLALAKLKKYLGTDWIGSWNDMRGRTKEQVVAALRGAARS
jgi:hypothetical protein